MLRIIHQIIISVIKSVNKTRKHSISSNFKLTEMFQQLNNLDSAFKFIRVFCAIIVLTSAGICCYTVFKATQVIKDSQHRVYFIANGKLIDAISIDKKEVLNVQMRKHIENFHFFFYSLEPDEDLIQKNITKALYLADDRAKTEYDNLREQRYFAGIVSSNISQRVDVDSIIINTDNSPASFTFHGKLKIIRPTAIVTRSLVTAGVLRPLQTISDNNSYGFLIERWRIIENKDLIVEKR